MTMIPTIARRSALALGVLIVLLSGCSSLQGFKTSDRHPPQFPLLTPESFPLRQQVNQVFTIKRQHAGGYHRQSMIAVWSTPDTRLIFSAFTPTGQPLISAQLVAGILNSENSPALPKSLSTRDVITQLQISYWPTTVIRSAIRDSAWSLSETETSRILFYHEKKIIEVLTLNSDHITLTHHLYGFTADIKTLKREMLP